MAMCGFVQVGPMLPWPSFRIFVGSVIGAFGIVGYVAILKSPVHLGISLALNQIITVLGCMYLYHGGLGSISCYKLIGILLTFVGIYLMNVK